MVKETQDKVQENVIADLIKAAKDEVDKKNLKNVHGSLLVPVALDGGISALVRLDSSDLKSGSVIPLQDEFAFHLMLATRVYGQIAAELHLKVDLKRLEIARKSAMNRVNHYIEYAYRDAYKVANEGGSFDLAKFNASLDKARKKLAPMAHTVLMEKIIEKTGIIFTEENLKKAKRIAETTPATDEDILYVNQAEGLVTLIKGSKHTAHERAVGGAFAHRQMITCRMNEDGSITPGLHPRIQIRTPSPVVKQGLSDEVIISDVADKLSEITKFYDLDHNLSKIKPKAFIYNRYTAINDRLGDIKGNLQTQSARHILLGAHKYNTNHIDDGVFCFVQNISVNGFGDTLGYESTDPLVRESTLMADMALMHTLCDEDTFAPLLKQYQNYLREELRAPYFSDTAHGNSALAEIKRIKTQWKKKQEEQVIELGPNDDELVLDAKESLKKLAAHDLHFTHECAKLVQTLSVFAEKASIGGCKSGNERAQAINGRVLMLDAMKPDDKIAKALAALANASEDGDATIAAAKALNTCINQEYNDRGLYAAASVISLVDQGASAKVEAKPKGWYISRNFAEESAEVMTNLKQSKAGKLQAHKGLTKYMRGAWSEHTLSDWAYLNSSALGVFGAVAALVTVIPAITAVLNNRIKKQHKIEARQRQNKRIQQVENFPQDKKKIKGWIKQIGRYGAKREPELHLTTQEKKALYRATHQGKTPKGAREDFIRFLGLKFLADGALGDTQKNLDKTVTLKDLLGEEGFRLYKRAIKEEGKSKSFRRAVFETSLKHMDGPTWKNRLILWIGGPSSSGKTFSANNVLKHLKTEHKDLLGVPGEGLSQEQPGNDVVFADGSFEREVSQMRQMVLQCALAKGYKGISDLHKHSSALSVKKYLKDTVLASKRFHMVIPETFTRPGAAKEMLDYESLSKRSNFIQVFSEIKPEKDHDERFKTAVKNMGASRAWRIGSFEAVQIAMNNTAIGCESKIYEPENFKWGRKLTKAFKQEYKKRSGCKVTLKITNDLVSLQKNAHGEWQECTFDDDVTGKKKGEDFLIIPARAYDDWLKVKQKEESSNLVDWYEKNKKNKGLTGPLIKFKDNEKYKKNSFSDLNRLSVFSRASSTSSESSKPVPRGKS